MDGKLNDLKTEAKSSRVVRLGPLTNIKDVTTNVHPDAVRHLMKKIIKLEIRKQNPIRYLATVTIKLVEAEIYAPKSRFYNLEMKVKVNLHE